MGRGGEFMNASSRFQVVPTEPGTQTKVGFSVDILLVGVVFFSFTFFFRSFGPEEMEIRLVFLGYAVRDMCICIEKHLIFIFMATGNTCKCAF